MIVYYAGVPGGGKSGDCRREQELIPFWKHRLWTYYWMNKDKGIMKKDETIKMFLDSGAFSAWTKNEVVDIDDYIAFVKEHKEHIDIYANLDVIGIGGKMPDRQTAEDTLANQHYIEAQGLSPLPVFHFGEPYEFLEYYVENYDYICLGIAGTVPATMYRWLNTCFEEYICDPVTRLPKVKVHGFAVTALGMMIDFPFYSVDSTSWVTIGRNGKIIIPHYLNGEWLYDKHTKKISVSSQSPDLKKTGQHIENVSPKEKEIILEYIHSKGYKLGSSEFVVVDADTYKLKDNEKWAQKKETVVDGKRRIERVIEPGLANQYTLRDEINIIYYQDLEKSLPKYPWAYKKQSNKFTFR